VAVVLVAAVAGWLLVEAEFGDLLDLLRIPADALPLPEATPW
jgi:hypothetical protein